MKLKWYSVVALLLLCGLFLCGYTSRGSSMVVQEIKEDYDSGYNSYNTIKLEGEYLTLPCKFNLLTDLGFALKEKDKEFTLEPFKYYTMVYVYNNNGDKIVVDVVNNTEESKLLSDCDIYELSIEVNKDNKTTIDVSLQDITFLSSLQTAQSVIGEENYVSDSYSGVYTASWKTEKYDKGILLTYDEGVGLIAIKVDVELPEGVEYAYSSESEESASVNAFPDDKESMTLTEMLKLFGKIALWIIVGFICFFTLIVFVVDACNSRNYIEEAEQELNEKFNMTIEVPESDYLVDKYKDYLDEEDEDKSTEEDIT